MSREEKRKAARQGSSIATKAKKDMIAWAESLDHTPNETEILAWQQGYISGVNRLNIIREEV